MLKFRLTVPAAVSLVEDHIEFVIYHKDRAAVRQPFVGGILQHQRLVRVARARLGELLEHLAVARNVLIVERDGVVGRRSGILAPVGIRRRGAPVGEAARVGEEIAALDPQFERVVVVLAVPLLGRSVGRVLQHHHHVGHGPARAHHVVTAVGEGLDLRFGNRPLGTGRRHPAHLLVVGEEVVVVGQVALKHPCGPRGAARVGHVGHRVVGIDHVHHHVGHLAHRLDVTQRLSSPLRCATSSDTRKSSIPEMW